MPSQGATAPGATEREDAARAALALIAAMVEASAHPRQVRIGFSLLDGRRFVLDTGARPALAESSGEATTEILCNAPGLVGLLTNRLGHERGQVFLCRGAREALVELAEALSGSTQVSWQ